MKKHTFWIGMMGGCALLGSAATVSAQTAITPEVLQQIVGQQEESAAVRALRNAMATTDLNKLAAANVTRLSVDGDFSDRVPSKGITDQKSSGRCWLFTGMNVLRAAAINRLNLPELELSQVYLFFYDQLEKSNLFLQGVIDTRSKAMDDRMVDWLFQNPLSDGGTFTGVADLVMKYGVVPKEAMPETYSSENTSRISHLLALKLREDGLKLRDAAAKGASAKKLEQQKVEMLAEVYHILTLAYGVPPTQFSWKRRDASGKVIATEQYTPKEFYAALWGEDLTADYVMLMNDPTRPYYNMYKIDYDRHTYDGHDWTYLNLPIEEIKPMAIASIRDSAAMYFSCDVGKYLYSASGTLDLDNYDYASLLGTSFTMNKEQRIRTHASASSHAMTLVGVDVIDTTTQKVGKWLVENSWGAASGWKGHLIMTDQWFDEYMFRLVVNRKYLSDKYRALLQQEAILLPAWDPMFQPEE